MATLLSCGAWTQPTQAQSSNWKIDQIYSNSTANVQFVELTDTVDGEFFVGNQTLTSNNLTFTFPSDLPNVGSTVGAHMLLATPGYFSLAGVPKADFTLPDHFFNAVGDTLTYGGGLDSVTIGNFQYPLDNVNSLFRSPPDATLTLNINSPKNFAGLGGDRIPPWENQDNPLDVDGNGKVQAHDALLIINDLLDHGTHSLAAPAGGLGPPPFLDVNGTNSVTPSDANSVITFLLNNSPPAAQPTEALSAPNLSMAMMSATHMNVPEPRSGVLALLGAGLLGFIWARQQTAAQDVFRRWIQRSKHRGRGPTRWRSRHGETVEPASPRQDRSFGTVPFGLQGRPDAWHVVPAGTLADAGQQTGATRA
ncbi:MAG TPA: dockerin type I domain-containing protein [Pirellulales bacterium]|nr:dockerin type I domain-containing protein [Pirellulales bacterium]